MKEWWRSSRESYFFYGEYEGEEKMVVEGSLSLGFEGVFIVERLTESRLKPMMRWLNGNAPTDGSGLQLM